MAEEPVPDGFDALTATSKQDYERRYLAGAQRYLKQYMATSVSLEEVGLRGDGLDVELHVLFRLLDRPDCLFGYRTRIWPEGALDDTSEPNEGDEVAETPEQVGSWTVMLGIDELVEQGGLRSVEAAPVGPTWI